MDFKDISPELREKAKGLKADELVQLAKQEGLELSDEQLEQIAGGGLWGDYSCPHCDVPLVRVGADTLQCPNCRRQFTA